MGITGDIRSISNVTPKSSDDHVEQMRQKIGTDFTSQKVSGKKKSELGKDDFMRLMSAQLKNQDPINPMKNDQMAAQLAQFSALEQMMNVNTNLEKMSAGQKPQEHMIAASLIGKRVTTDSSHFVLERGQKPEISFNLPTNASAVSVAVVDSKGQVLREYELGAMQEGKQSLRWDGKNAKNQEQTPGEYGYKVTASDENGKSMQIKMDSSGLISGVSFEGGKALLLVDGKKIPMEEVGKIEADAPNAAPAQAPGLEAALGAFAKDAATKGAVNQLTDNKQNKTSVDAPPAKNSTAQSNKKSLPNEMNAEKIKSMLAALAPSMVGEGEAEQGGATEENVPMPLWNPNQ